MKKPAIEVDSKIIRRPLYANERMAWAMDRIYPFNIQARISVEGRITLALLKKALNKLQLRHPYLQAGITGEANDPYIVYGTALKIPVLEVKVRNKEESKNIALLELHTQIPLYPGPLVRVVLINYIGSKASDLILTIHHAICDGVCGMHVIHELLGLVNNIRERKTLVYSSYDEFTPFEKRILKNEKLDLSMGSSYDKEQKDNYQKLNENISPSDKVEDCERSTYQINTIIDETRTQQIIAFCKAAKIKMDALMAAVAMLALQKKINFYNRENHQSLILSKTLINMRPFLEVVSPKQQLGYYVSCIGTLQRIAIDQDLLALAQKIQAINEKNFNLDIPSLNIMNLNGLMAPFFSKEEMLKKCSYTHSTVTVSNLGVLEFPAEAGEIKLKYMDCAMTSHVFPLNENVFTLILFTLQGKLNLNFQFAKPYITSEAAEMLMANTLELLKFSA